MNVEARRTDGEPTAREERFLNLIDTATQKVWHVRLEADILTLIEPSKGAVLKLHRDETARYLRITWDMWRGRRLTFVIIEGVRVYSFSCANAEIMQLLAWLPQGVGGHLPHETAKEIRYSGLSVVLLGVLHLVVPELFFWGCGIGLLMIGMLAVANPRRSNYAINGIGLMGVGFYDVAGLPKALLPGMNQAQNNLTLVLVGTVLVLWGVFQLLRLGPDQRLRVARALRDEQAAFLPAHSRLVRLVGWWNLAAAASLLTYMAGLLLVANNHPSMKDIEPDLAVLGVLIVLTLSSGLIFLVRRRAAYFEAKVSAQALIAMAIFFLEGTTVLFRPGDPLSIFGALFSAHVELIASPYIWCTMVLSVFFFNRWFARAVDRELEEQRD
jgi:hypothetical protein